MPTDGGAAVPAQDPRLEAPRPRPGATLLAFFLCPSDGGGTGGLADGSCLEFLRYPLERQEPHSHSL